MHHINKSLVFLSEDSAEGLRKEEKRKEGPFVERVCEAEVLAEEDEEGPMDTDRRKEIFWQCSLV